MNAVDIHGGDELRDLYRELILDHAKSPRHFGKLDGATHWAEGINPLCGDKLKLFLRVDDEQVIDSASFEGSGCAISVASASLLTDLVIGMDVSTALDTFGAVTTRLTEPGDHPNISGSLKVEKLRALDGVREFPTRVKCATLAWHALNSAINKHSTPASTE